MRKKVGGIIKDFAAGEDVVAACVEEIKRVDPTSKADRLLHITLKTGAAARFTMDGFTFTTDDSGIFSSPVFDSVNTVEVSSLSFEEAVTGCIVCFLY